MIEQIVAAGQRASTSTNLQMYSTIVITDEAKRERIAAKNSLESYCFQMKSSLEDEKFKDKISEGDRKTILDKCEEAIRWLDGNQTAEKDEFADKQKEVEAVCNPIITKLYQQAGGQPGGQGGMPGGQGMPSGAAAGAGPTVEEVD